MDIPIAGQRLPENDLLVVVADGDHPGVRHALTLGPNAHVRVQTETQQQIAQQDRVVLTVPAVPDQERVQVHPLLLLLADAE